MRAVTALCRSVCSQRGGGGALALRGGKRRRHDDPTAATWCVSTSASPGFPAEGLVVLPGFVTAGESARLMAELGTPLRRLRYDSHHWDEVITGYREVFKSAWKDPACAELMLRVTERVRDVSGHEVKPHVHVLDLAADGEIRHHVDTPVAGPVIAGLSLLSPAVMNLRCAPQPPEQEGGGPASKAETLCLLPENSLYVMFGRARTDYEHAILRDPVDPLRFGPAALAHLPPEYAGEPITGWRRVSLIFRDHGHLAG